MVTNSVTAAPTDAVADDILQRFATKYLTHNGQSKTFIFDSRMLNGLAPVLKQLALQNGVPRSMLIEVSRLSSSFAQMEVLTNVSLYKLTARETQRLVRLYRQWQREQVLAQTIDFEQLIREIRTKRMLTTPLATSPTVLTSNP